MPAIPTGKLRPREEQCFVQGHAEGWKPGPPRPPGPASRPAPASLRGLQRETQHTHRAQTGKAWLAARSRPTLMTAAQVAVASGSGSQLLAARRVPEPRATASSPRSPAGGAGGRGRSPAQAPPAHPSFCPPRTALLAPRGWSRACTHAGNRRTHRRAYAAVIGAGSRPPGCGWDIRPAWLHVPPAPRCVGRARDPTSRSPRFPLGEMGTVIVSASESYLRIR